MNLADRCQIRRCRAALEIRCASAEHCNLHDSDRRFLIPHSLQPRRRNHDGGQLLAAQPVLFNKVDKSHDDFALTRRKGQEFGGEFRRCRVAAHALPSALACPDSSNALMRGSTL
jgi:hypothetical protein